jgi:hypothetical protein
MEQIKFMFLKKKKNLHRISTYGTTSNSNQYKEYSIVLNVIFIVLNRKKTNINVRARLV